jgi:hypothetical protein
VRSGIVLSGTASVGGFHICCAGGGGGGGIGRGRARHAERGAHAIVRIAVMMAPITYRQH